jgi:hypothetical protein
MPQTPCGLPRNLLPRGGQNVHGSLELHVREDLRLNNFSSVEAGWTRWQEGRKKW